MWSLEGLRKIEVENYKKEIEKLKNENSRLRKIVKDQVKFSIRVVELMAEMDFLLEKRGHSNGPPSDRSRIQSEIPIEDDADLTPVSANQTKEQSLVANESLSLDEETVEEIDKDRETHYEPIRGGFVIYKCLEFINAHSDQ